MSQQNSMPLLKKLKFALLFYIGLFVFITVAYAQTAAEQEFPLPEMGALVLPVYEEYDTIVLQGLNKITARVQQFEVPVEGLMQFGTLSLYGHTCRKTPPEEKPESAAFLEIRNAATSQGTVAENTIQLASGEELFSGWMFASSPALSTLEHPVYDVWVLDCINASTKAEGNGAE